MGQRENHAIAAVLTIVALALLSPAGCRPAGQSSRAAKRPTVASSVPPATDLLLGMGAGDHLVAVSKFDHDRDGIRGLPRACDYETFDWEQLSAIRPDVMVVYMAPDRMPQGLREKAGQLNIRLVNVRTERLADVFVEMVNLGKIVSEPEKADAAIKTLRTRLDAVRRRVEGKPRPRVLMVREQSPEVVVGRDNFLTDVLELAGGENVIQAGGWPSIDREKLQSLKPDVILHLLPEASPQVLAEAAKVWKTLPQIPAVANNRTFIFSEWYLLQPGWHLGEVAEKFAEVLHPSSSSGSSTFPASTRSVP